MVGRRPLDADQVELYRRAPPAGLGFFVGQRTTDIPMLSAATIIVILPIVIIYLLFQRSFVAGLLQGAIKG